MKPYLIETTFDCIRTGDKFRYEPLGETFLKTEIFMVYQDCKVNCVKLRTGSLCNVSEKSNIYVKG